MSEHQEYGPASGGGACSKCDQAWPCQDELSDRLAASESARASLEAEVTRLREGLEIAESTLNNCELSVSGLENRQAHEHALGVIRALLAQPAAVGVAGG